MRVRLIALALSALLVTTLPAVRAAEADSPQDGVEVLTRGPVHEAYAEPGVNQPGPTPIVSKEPPDAVNEVPADQKPEGRDVQWIPGYWSWDDERNDFVWLSGFWRVPPPGRQWVPGSWRQVQDGWQWSPGFWAPSDQGQLDYLPPPPDPVEAAPSVPAPSANSIYVPGVWVYRQTRFLWRPGCWIAYRPGWVWVPAHYVWTPAGYVFVEGYWDYPLRDRGLLFAPVVIERRFLVRPGWSYVPTFVIYDDFLQCALFVRPGLGWYYFGDYYAAPYRRAGFVAWVDFRIGRSYDPLFSFYLRANSSRRGWERDLRGLYADRFAGKAPLPPRTLAQQNTLIQKITNKTVNVTNVRNVTVVAPLAKLDRKVFHLESVSREQMAHTRAATTRLVQVGTQRRKLETQLLAKGPAPTRTSDTVRSIKLDLPKTTRTGGRDGIKVKTPPASPITTRLVEHPTTRKDQGKPPDKPKKDSKPPDKPKKDSKPPDKPKKDSKPPDKPKKDSKPPDKPKKDSTPPEPKKDAKLPEPMKKKPPPPTELHAGKPPTHEVKTAPKTTRHEVKLPPPPTRHVTAAPVRHDVKSPAPRHEAKAGPAKNDKGKK
jgi:hypothetical protein